MDLDKRLQDIFDELQEVAYNPTYHNYYFKEANQVIRKHVEKLLESTNNGGEENKFNDKGFNEWFKANETRFAHAQFDDEQIAYSAWVNSRTKKTTR
ncbi:MAG: hypothetical protein GY928_18675 [Colwellia sp.]|nr:hypothetical protein [Colwellia sp.]